MKFKLAGTLDINGKYLIGVMHPRLRSLYLDRIYCNFLPPVSRIRVNKIPLVNQVAEHGKLFYMHMQLTDKL